MCGIVGTVNTKFDKNVLNLIAHRGPDDSGIEKLIVDGKEIIFGHRRLSIQDLSPAGHQPMYSACKRFLIVFNGEIYNHYELRQRLQNITFNGHSDTETIINYIARFGIESVREFNGIFAFAVLDIENKKLYLVRDRFGVKPLYYRLDRSILMFSSEIRPIKASAPTTTLDQANLAELLKLRYNPAPDTLFSTINKLRPGHTLNIDLADFSIVSKSFQPVITINRSLDFDDAVKRYGELFEQAIVRQMLADVEVGVLLSGGVDSALVAYFAQKHSATPIKTFTVGFEEAYSGDESEAARKTSAFLGTEHYETRMSFEDFETLFRKAVAIIEEPLGTTSILPMYYLSQLASQHVKVVLTGQGADEPLGGYARYRGEVLRRRLPAFLWSGLKLLMPLFKNDKIYRALFALGERDIRKRFEKIYTLFTDEQIAGLIHIADDKSLQRIAYFYELLDGNGRLPVEAMMRIDSRMNLADDLLLYTDKITMHFSLEARVPLLDNDLVQFMETIPYNFKMKGNHGKFIHKKFAESVLPKGIVHRKKLGFQSPTEQWFKGPHGERFKVLLSDTSSKFAHYVDTRAVQKVFAMHLKGERNMEKQLFTLLSLYYWMEEYL